MHYAEFGEDEVGHFVRHEPLPLFAASHTDEKGPECGAAVGHQGVRRQQMEGHRPEGWQTRKSRPPPPKKRNEKKKEWKKKSRLTGTRHASSMRKNTLAASSERSAMGSFDVSMNTVCIFPGLARWALL